MEEKKRQSLIENLREDLENLERYVEEFSLFLPLAIYTINPIGIVVDVNQTARNLSGYEEVKAKVSKRPRDDFIDKKQGKNLC